MICTSKNGKIIYVVEIIVFELIFYQPVVHYPLRPRINPKENQPMITKMRKLFGILLTLALVLGLLPGMSFSMVAEGTTIPLGAGAFTAGNKVCPNAWLNL